MSQQPPIPPQWQPQPPQGGPAAKPPLYTGDNAFGRLSRNAQVGVGCVTLLIACCVLFGIVSAFNGGGGKGTANADQPTTQQQTTNTTGPTATPKPTNTATATPKPKAWTTVNHFAGNGISKTAPFTVNADQWKILWSCDPQAYGFEYNLIAELTKPGDSYGDPVVNSICKTDDPSTTKGETMEYSGGTFYLNVNSEATWVFDIQVLQ